MPLGERPRAQLPVGQQVRLVHRVDVHGPLPVAQLAPVERAALRPVAPAEEDVAGRLGEALAGHHALALVLIAAALQVRLEYGAAGLLDLEEQHIVDVTPREHADEAARPHGAHAHDLQRQVLEPVPREQLDHVAVQRVAVRVVVHAHAAVEVADVEALRQVAERDDKRGLRDDGAPAVLHYGQLGGRLGCIPAGGASGRPLGVGPEHRVVDAGEDLVGAHLRVPRGQCVHAGEPAHEVTVGARTRERDGSRLLPAEAVAAGSDDEAGDEPLHVPLERARQCLVEVVDVEDQRALRRAVQAEVEQVRIAAQLHFEAGARARLRGRRHHRRRAAVEAERVLEHARVADGQERLESVGLLGGDDGDGIGAVGLRLPRSQRLERHGRALRFARGRTLLEGEMPPKREGRPRGGGHGRGGPAQRRRRRRLLRRCPLGSRLLSRRRQAQRLRRLVVCRLQRPARRPPSPTGRAPSPPASSLRA